MRRLSTAIFKNYETSDFLMNEPQYLQLKEKVERYRMRNQQLASILQKKIEEQVQRFISSCQCVQENDQYKVIKVHDLDVRDLGRCYELTQTREWDDGIFSSVNNNFRNFKVKSKTRAELNHVRSEKNIRSLRLMKSNSKKDQSELKNQRINDPHDTSVNKNLKESQRLSRLTSQMRDSIEDKSNYNHMGNNFVPQSEKKSSIISSLSSLRSKRKKVFDDDVWNEFEKI